MRALLFLLSRALQGLLALLVVACIAFVLFQFVGDPTAQMLDQNATEADRHHLRAQLGLDRPALEQFASFVRRAAEGDFGVSLQQGRPVAQLLAERVPATLELCAIAAVLALAVGIPLGIYTALHHKRASSHAILALSLAGNSLPTFLIGIFLILIFGVVLGVMPTFGRGETTHAGGWTSGLLTLDGWRHLVLPALTLSLYQLTLIVRLVRGELLEVLSTDFIRFARARGLPARAIHVRHALRNAMVPVITVAGLQLGSIIAFGIVTETV